METITKIDSNTIEVIKTPAEQITTTFTPEYLKTQREAILKNKEEQIAQRDLEIAEIDGYLVKMTELNVVEKPIEEFLQTK